MLSIARREILPAVMLYAAELAGQVNAIEAVGAKPRAAAELMKTVNTAANQISGAVDALDAAVQKATAVEHAEAKADAFRKLVVPQMVALRKVADGVEPLMPADLWPLATYAEMLFYR
jgi:glutamine synthetase